MIAERRKFERYPCTALGSCEGSTNTPMGVKCHDISASGAGLTSAERLPEGTHLRINLCTKAEKRSLLLKGIVRWCSKTPDEWQAGVEFHKPVTFPLAMVL